MNATATLTGLLCPACFPISVAREVLNHSLHVGSARDRITGEDLPK